MLGLDTASTPTLEQCRAVRAAWGIEFFGAYIGGSCVYSAWDPAVVAALLADGFGILPYYVGQQTARVCGQSGVGRLTYAQGLADAVDAIAKLEAYGLFGVPPCLDIEQETFTDHPLEAAAYAQGFVQGVHNAGSEAWAYSGPGGLHILAGRLDPPDRVVIGAYPKEAPSLDPGAHAPADYPLAGWSTPGQRAWQYTDQIQGAGKTWDAIRSDLPVFKLTPTPTPEVDMTPKEHDLLQEIHNTLFGGEEDSLARRVDGSATSLLEALNDPEHGLAAIKAVAGTAQPGGAGAPDPRIQQLLDTLSRIETAFKNA